MAGYVPGKFTPRVVELRVWIDVTGPGSFSVKRLDRIIDHTVAECVKGVEAAGLQVHAKGGDWCAYYPINAGNIDRPGRNHEIGA